MEDASDVNGFENAEPLKLNAKLQLMKASQGF